MDTFERYLKELRDKYPPGIKIRSNTQPEIDGQNLRGIQILEIPASNKNFERIDEYKAIAKRYGIEIRFPEAYTKGTNRSSADSAYWKFRKVQTLGMVDFNRYAPLIQSS